MLTQSFKSATDLRISSELHDALMKTLVMLETEAIAPKMFDMGSWPTFGVGCWSGGCIGAWAERIMGRAIETGDSYTTGLDALFYPPEYDGPFCPYNATPEKGARALRNYLTSGEADWDGVMRHVQL